MKKKNPAAVALGRLGGRANKGKTSEAKAAAARANGRKGGRPRKDAPAGLVCPRCGRLNRNQWYGATCRNVAACARRAAKGGR